MGQLLLTTGPCNDHVHLLSIFASPSAPTPYSLQSVERRLIEQGSVLELVACYPDEANFLKALDVLLSGFEGKWNYLGTFSDERGRVVEVALPVVNVPQFRCSELGCHGVVCANHFFFPAMRACGIWNISFYCPVPGCGAVYCPDGGPKSFTDGHKAYLVALKGPNGAPQIKQVAIQVA